jgi:hypothetical protein
LLAPRAGVGLAIGAGISIDNCRPRGIEFRQIPSGSITAFVDLPRGLIVSNLLRIAGQVIGRPFELRSRQVEAALSPR